MTTTDASAASFWQARKGGKDQETAEALALRAPIDGQGSLASAGLSWTPRAAQLFKEIARQASRSGSDEGKALPYASLRAAVIVSVQEATYVETDLGGPWKGRTGAPRPFVEADCTPSQLAERVRGATDLWGQMTLRGWAERTKVDEGVVDALLGAVDGDEALAEAGGTVALDSLLAPDAPFRAAANAILQIVGRRLEGQELFEGLGPVFRVVRGRSDGRAIELETWPAPGNGGLFSMVARLSVETQPWMEGHIVTVEATRRRWMGRLPTAAQLRGQRGVGCHLIGSGRPPVAVAVDCAVRRGEIMFPATPAFMQQAIRVEADLAAGSVGDMILRGPAGGVFMGLPYTTRFGKHPVKAGASSTDQLDLFDKVAAALSGLGFGPFAATKVRFRVPGREEYHAGIDLSTVVTDMAQSLGHNDLSPQALQDARARLTGYQKGADEIPADVLATGRAKLAGIRSANGTRLKRVHPGGPPSLVVVARTEKERTTLSALAQALFGRIRVETRTLPPGTHGLRDTLECPAEKARPRFEARVRAWAPLLRDVEAIPRCHVIVQAAEEYDGKHEDGVNKMAGRYALASGGNAAVQYLRPPEAGADSLANYLHRVQAALNDLLFGHSGSVARIDEAVTACFGDKATRPTSLIGLSVVTQARLRLGALGGKVCLATRVDVASGQTLGRVGWFDAAMRWSPKWLPMPELLQEVARLNATGLGPDRDTEKNSYQQFVRSMLDEALAAGERPLVLVDSTSAGSLWPWLTDRNAAAATVSLAQEEFQPRTRWPNMRVVRVRTGVAARIIVRKTRDYEEMDAASGRPTGRSVTRPTTTMSGGAYRVGPHPHYWCGHNYFQVSFPRGLSVYRQVTTFRKAGKDAPAWHRADTGALSVSVARDPLYKENYRLPSTVEATVLLDMPEDDPDAVAAFVDALRHGYGHTASWTSLPAPLSFESKVRDYMTRFALEKADAEDEEGMAGEAPPEDDGEDDDGTPAEAGGGNADVIANALVGVMGMLDGDIEVPGAATDARPGVAEGDLFTLPAGRGEKAVPLRLVLPDTVDVEWISKRVNVPPRNVRLLHERRRDLLLRCPDLGWPEDHRPGQGELARVIRKAMLSLDAWHAIHDVAGKHKIEFRPFAALTKRLRGIAVGLVGSAAIRSAPQELRHLIEAGDVLSATEFVVAWGCWFHPAHDPELISEVVRHPALAAFLGSAGDDPEPPDQGLPDHEPPPRRPYTAEDENECPEIAVPDHENVPLPAATAGEAPVSAAFPLPEVPGAVPASAMTDAVSAWSDALARLAATCASGAGPLLDTLLAIESAVADARSAFEGYEAARPRFAAVAPVLVRLEGVRDALAALEGEAVPAVPGDIGGEVPEQDLANLESLAARAEAAIVAAAEATASYRALGNEIMGAPRYNPVLVAQLQQAGESQESTHAAAREALVSALSSVSSSLAVAARDRAETVPSASSPAALPAPAAEPVPAATPDAAQASGPVSVDPAVQVEAAASVEAAVLVLAQMPDPADMPPETDQVSDEDQELLASMMAEELPAVPSPDVPEMADADGAEDGLDAEVRSAAARVADLFAAGEYSLAWHLLRAGHRAYGEGFSPFGLGELALAACARCVDDGSGYASAMGGEMAEAQEVARTLDASDPLSAERALVLYAVALVPALVRQDRVALDLLTAAQPLLAGDIGTVLHPLREAAADLADQGVLLTAAMLRAAQGAEVSHSEVATCRQALEERIASFQRLDFRFSNGKRIRIRICAEGAVGELGRGLEGDRVVEAARNFGSSLGERPGVLAEIERASEAVGCREAIDGPGRERLIRNLLDLASACRAYVAAYEADRDFSGWQLRESVVRSRGTVLSTVDKVRRLRPAAVQGAPARAGGYGLMDRALDAVEAAFHGNPAVSSHVDRMLSLYARLAWIPQLDFGRSWLPQPYQPDAIARTLADPALPLLPPPGGDRDWLFGEVVRERLSRGSFVGAEMLLDAAAFFGIGAAAAEEARASFDADLPTRRDALREHVGRVRRETQRVQRFVVENLRPEDVQLWLSQLADVEQSEVPARCKPDERTEEEIEAGRAQDFATAEQIVYEVGAKARAALEKPRGVLRKAVGEAKGLSDAERAPLLALLERDELVAVQERLELTGQNLSLPLGGRAANRRWSEFFPAIPELLLRLTREEQEALPNRIASGTDVGFGTRRLAFSRVPESAREEAKDIFMQWRVLRRALESASDAKKVFGAAEDLLVRLGFEVRSLKVDQGLTHTHKRQYVADVKLAFADDAESMLLPDFGSRTRCDYRLCLFRALPDKGDLNALASGAGDRATIVLATEVIGQDRRVDMALESMSSAVRKVLAIDESILLFSLSEAERRPLTLLECAQPFSRTQPFGDYGRYSGVPPEMFFGRQREYQRVFESSGSCVVYGGRRLGKTALLKHIEHEEHRPETGVVVVHVPVDDIGVGRPMRPTEIWALLAGRMRDVFEAQPVRTPAEFERGARAWLDRKPGRRILVLLDEADKFIEEEASGAGSFTEFRALQRLMDETNRRFKFVLAGLHNVTRLVHAENSPMGQIAAEPQRIGPLLGPDVGDAERLVVKSMAAMGWSFENREDVWAVLSHTNYYPVLAQTFCQHLLDTLAAEVRQTQAITWVISSETVRRVLDSEAVRASIKEKFEHTIKELDPRYELITYAIAVQELRGREEGEVAEGLTPADIRDLAVRYWPKGKDQVSRLSTIEALLDEMEGLGVLRRTRRDRWSLRSPSVLALLGTIELAQEHLNEFADKDPRRPFDPRSLRREIAFPKAGDPPQRSPLTFGQEQDVLLGPDRVVVVFGMPVTDIDAVATALVQAARSDGSSLSRVTVTPRSPENLDDLRGVLRPSTQRGEDARHTVVIGHRSPWDRSWVEEALRSKRVREGKLTVVFVGSTNHALAWAKSDGRVLPGLRVETLQPWTSTAIDDLASREGVSYDELSRMLVDGLGGYGKAIRRAMRSDRKIDKGLDLVRKNLDPASSELGTRKEFGLPDALATVLSDVQGICGEAGLTAYYLADVMEGDRVEGLDARAIVRAAVLTAMVEPLAFREDVDEDAREYRINPLAAAAWASQA